MSITVNYWPDFFERFFAKNHERISNILNAGSCREIWLQGELYLEDMTHINLKSNEFKLVDIHGKASDDHPEMITEIKIIGVRGFDPNDVFGHGGATKMEEYFNDCDGELSDHDHKEESHRHSLYRDYKKLSTISRNTKKDDDFKFEKYQLLVISYHEKAHGSKGKNVKQKMQEVLEKIKIQNNFNHWEWDYSNPNEHDAQKLSFKVRLWRIKNV